VKGFAKSCRGFDGAIEEVIQLEGYKNCDACSNLNLVPPKIVCMCNPFTKNDSVCYQNHIDDLGIR
jgi:hypothetical protein